MGARKTFPYPVLGNGDDVGGDFKPQLSYTVNPDLVVVKCMFETTNDYIFDLISEGKAKYVVEIECANTYYRKLTAITSDSVEVEIMADKLRERVEVQFYICASSAIEEYYPTGTHVDFGNDPFYIDSGDVLALGGSTSFVVAKEFDPLSAPISSIIKLEAASNNSSEMRVMYDSDRIIIELAKQDFKTYSQTKDRSAEMLHSALVLPVLVDAIYEIGSRGSGNYQDFPWSERLRQICIDRQIDIEEPLSAAQKILNNPISRTLNWRNEELLSDEGY